MRLCQTPSLCKKGFGLGRKLDELRGGRIKAGTWTSFNHIPSYAGGKDNCTAVSQAVVSKDSQRKRTHTSHWGADTPNSQHPLGNWFLRNIHLTHPCINSTIILFQGFLIYNQVTNPVFFTKSQGLAGTAIFLLQAGDMQYPNWVSNNTGSQPWLKSHSSAKISGHLSLFFPDFSLLTWTEQPDNILWGSLSWCAKRGMRSGCVVVWHTQKKKKKKSIQSKVKIKYEHLK